MNKQETLKEVAERFYPPKTTDLICSPKLVRDAFEAGAKWQAERMYSEEEARAIWNAGQEYWRTSGDSITFEELTEKFKNK